MRSVNNVVYLRPAPRRHPLLTFLIEDWQRTRADLRSAWKLLRDYRQLRATGLHHRAALYNARRAV